MRPVLSKLQISTLAIGLALGGLVACGDDADPAPQGDGNYNPGGDGDGNGNGNNNGGDGDQNNGGDGDQNNGQCQTGASQACTCSDGVTQGSQVCVFGQFGECSGCPCSDGAVQACQCAAGGIGSQTCSAGSFGECTCEDVDPTVACPASTTCSEIGGELIKQFSKEAALPTTCNVETPLVVIIPLGNVPAPPACTSDTDCAGLGFASNVKCVDNPFSYDVLPPKVCIQNCQAATTAP